ncbi:transporter [Effusibacillus lacus]|uniref:Transporter n=1 Tax=Effusibacillus lacus TaxID=1348429 RepID=A0A292YIS5_9BACL|nr:cation diffusion facilitator family transporter [Effusibacillus lacus]TCS74342.1 cation diffusion facilitator family transporter [Effusibacillus lacus]GAX88799.1 transporter [Effusibacillus lacus]
MERYDQIRMGERGAWVSITAYIALSVVKIITGGITQSQALIADGANNITDMFASVAVLIGLKLSRKPPDENHPYGHFRAETVASLIASFIMLAVGMQVVIQAFRSVMQGVTVTPDITAGWISLVCAAVMLAVYSFNSKLARRINSQAVMAAAKDNLSDALVSVGAAVGIFGSRLGLMWLDPLAAIIVGLLICRTGWGIFREASHNLTDGFDKDQLDKLQDTIQSIPGVDEVKDIKARTHGSHVLVDVVILVDPDLNVVESHEITEEIEELMWRKHKIRDVHVHIEPVENIKCSS